MVSRLICLYIKALCWLFFIFLVLLTLSGCTFWLDADKKKVLVTTERIEDGKIEKTPIQEEEN